MVTYNKIANFYRNKINPKVIAITGSSGKTTTKELLSCILSKKYKVHKTEKNFNNEVGLPKTILEMPEDTEVLVLELGMRGLGEIEFISKTAEPNISLITNIGTAHIGRLGSKENIAKAKSEILTFTKDIAVLIDDPLLLDTIHWDKELLTYSSFEYEIKSEFEGKTKFLFNEEEYLINQIGSIHLLNAIAAIKISKQLELSHNQIQEGLQKFHLPVGRGNVLKKGNKYIIDESYNANPDSLKEAIECLIRGFKKDFKVLVVGEIAELGNAEESLMTELGLWIKNQNINQIISIGSYLEKIPGLNVTKASDISHCCDILEGLKIDQAKKIAILIKGSRVSKLDLLVDYLSGKGNFNGNQEKVKN